MLPAAGYDIGKWICFCLAGRDIYERICERRASPEILRAEGLLEARGIAEILQLALFRIAIPVHPKAAADNKFMRARSPQQAGWARAGRPGETETWTKVIVFCCDAAGGIASRIP